MDIINVLFAVASVTVLMGLGYSACISVYETLRDR